MLVPFALPSINKMADQKFLIERGKIESTAGLFNDLEAVFGLRSYPCERAAQSLSLWEDSLGIHCRPGDNLRLPLLPAIIA